MTDLKKDKKMIPNIRFKGFTEDWEQRKLGELFSERSERSADGELIAVTTKNGVKKANELSRKDNSSSDKSNYKIVEQGDIAYNTMRMWQGASGYSPYKGILSPAYTVIKPLDQTYSLFFAYLFKLVPVIQEFQRNSQGLTSDTFNLKYPAFSKIIISTPSMMEQKELASFLNSIDQLLTLHQRKLKGLEELKKLLLQKMFPQNGQNRPDIRFDGFTDDWEERKLGEFTTSFSGGTPSAGNSSYYQGDIPFIRSGEINSDKTELFLTEDGLKNSSAKMVSVGDILYALYGATSGEVGISQISGAINQAILAIKPSSGYSSEFIMQWLKLKKQKIIDKYLQGGQGNLSGSIVKDLVLNVPDFEEQQKIGSFFKQIDDTIALHQRKLQKLNDVKQLLLQNMFV